MSKIDTFDKRAAKLFQDELRQMAEKLAVKHGVTLGKSRVTYSGVSLSIKLEFETEGETGFGEAGDMWNNCAYMHGLPIAWLGREFKTRDGNALTITGYNPKAPKNCIEFRGADGKAYKGSINFVQQYADQLNRD